MSWVLFAIASAAFASISYICAKKALKKEHAYEFLITVLFLNVIFSLPFLIGIEFTFNIYWWLIIAKGIVFGLAAHAALRSFRHLELSEAVPLKNLESLFVLVIALFLLMESITRLNILGILLLLTGTFFLERTSHKTSSIFDFSFLKNKFVILAILSVVLFAISAIIDKITVPILGFRIVWIFGHLVAISFMYIIFKIQKRSFKKMIPRLKKNKSWIIGSAATGTISLFFYYFSLSIPGALIAIIVPLRRLASIFTILVSGQLFHDHNIKYKAFASILMIIGFVLTVI